jgi:import receptor subunit TOM20
LDADLIGTGQYCSYCLKVTPKGSSIHAHLDPFHASYCSQECQKSAEDQYESLLFGAVAPVTPANPNPVRTKAQVEERRKIQEKFADQIKESGKNNALLIIRFVGQLLADEHQRLLGSELKYDLPQVDKDSKLVYSFYDYIERLRSIELTVGPQETTEMELSRELLKCTVEGLEEFLDEEKYMVLKGKMAYNCFGVMYGAGRTTKVCTRCGTVFWSHHLNYSPNQRVRQKPMSVQEHLTEQHIK